jgi:hypothetical protein
MLLPPGSDYRWEHTLKNPDNINHCIEYIVMIGQNQARDLRARLLLMSQMLDEPCFNTLRTQEQLGYIVGSGMMVMNTVQGFRILIQSEKDCAFLEKRIDNFLINFDKELEDMSEDDFDKHKIGLINKRLEKLKNLSEESGRLWHHVASEAFDFDLGKFPLTHICHMKPAATNMHNSLPRRRPHPTPHQIRPSILLPLLLPPFLHHPRQSSHSPHRARKRTQSRQRQCPETHLRPLSSPVPTRPNRHNHQNRRIRPLRPPFQARPHLRHPRHNVRRDQLPPRLGWNG